MRALAIILNGSNDILISFGKPGLLILSILVGILLIVVFVYRWLKSRP